MTHFFAPHSSSTPRWRNLLVATLAILLVLMGTPQSRAAVVLAQNENKLQRIYETEVHTASHAILQSAKVKQGRKPYEWLHFEERPLFVAHQNAPQSPDWLPAGARAPPHSPRGPPAVVS